MSPNADWAPVLPIRQNAATLWYHANTPNRTAQQVYNGPCRNVAGEDEVSKSLPIPNHYGVDDFPVIIQDKRLITLVRQNTTNREAAALLVIRCWLTVYKARTLSLAWLGALATAERVELSSLSTTDERWSPVTCDFWRSGIPACSCIGEATFAGTGRAPARFWWI
ncbi:SufI protein [Escherichia coli]|uniref:SufI protein n=1 Tax=Escherichia coli TaxID=562 RepID=A0A2X3LP08_ECOLX|nr:SufI protein [Escherichia coli]